MDVYGSFPAVLPNIADKGKMVRPISKGLKAPVITGYLAFLVKPPVVHLCGLAYRGQRENWSKKTCP